MKKQLVLTALCAVVACACAPRKTSSSLSSSLSLSLAEKVDTLSMVESNTFVDTYKIRFTNGTYATFELDSKKSNLTKEMNFNSDLDMQEEGGADYYDSCGDHESDYFYSYDFYNAKNTDSLTILPKFKTYQQTSESTCGACALYMVMNYLGIEGNYNEEIIWNSRCEGTNVGSSTKQLISVAEKYIGDDYKIESTYDFYDEDYNLDYDYFYSYEGMSMVKNYIKRGIPVIIAWNDWGGHFETIIGYDDMGTEDFGDDVMIVADSYDTSDHTQDGYGVYGYERFFYNWSMYDFYADTEVEYERDFMFMALVPNDESTLKQNETSEELKKSSEILSVDLVSNTTSEDTYKITFEDNSTYSFKVENSHSNLVKEMNINTDLDMQEEGGADYYDNCGDHESNYFSNLDFYNLESTDTLSILTHFETYQQTSEATCGGCSVLMSLNYLGKLGDLDEKKIWEARCEGTNVGSSTKQLLSVLDTIDGISYTSTYDYYDEDYNLDYDYFYSYEGMSMIENNIKQGNPVIIGWNDWGGHFETVIGYDNMGTEDFGDDVLIVADSYDTSDHSQDGYGVYGYERFFYNWTMYDFYAGTEVEYERDFMFIAISLDK